MFLIYFLFYGIYFLMEIEKMIDNFDIRFEMFKEEIINYRLLFTKMKT